MPSHLFALPAELAKPVAQGMLPKAHAQAALMAAALKAARLGQLPGEEKDPVAVGEYLCHLLDQHIRHHEALQDYAEGDARRAEWVAKRANKGKRT